MRLPIMYLGFMRIVLRICSDCCYYSQACLIFWVRRDRLESLELSKPLLSASWGCSGFLERHSSIKVAKTDANSLQSFSKDTFPPFSLLIVLLILSISALTFLNASIFPNRCLLAYSRDYDAGYQQCESMDCKSASISSTPLSISPLKLSQSPEEWLLIALEVSRFSLSG